MGWILAELRGRLDPDSPHPPAKEKPPTLLLDSANERSSVERQIEATKILSNLAGMDLLKIDIKTLSGVTSGTLPVRGIPPWTYRRCCASWSAV
jgi:hypothetical protein